MIRTDPLLKIAAIMTNYCASHALARCGKDAPAPHARGERPRRGGGPWPQTKKGPSRPLRAETPCMSGTAYPPTDCTAVLSAMGSLTAGFGMGPGDPPLHGSAHAGRSPARDECIPFSIQGPPWGLHSAQRTLFSLISDREDESR